MMSPNSRVGPISGATKITDIIKNAPITPPSHIHQLLRCTECIPSAVKSDLKATLIISKVVSPTPKETKSGQKRIAQNGT